MPSKLRLLERELFAPQVCVQYRSTVESPAADHHALLECKIPDKMPARDQSTGHRCRGGCGGSLHGLCGLQDSERDAAKHRICGLQDPESNSEMQRPL